MTNPWCRKQPAYLSSFAEHLLRWNKGINLVSRQNTDQLLEDLFRQCSGGFSALWSRLEELNWAPPLADGSLHYFDLGSGGGFPGVIWHYRFCQKGLRPRTCLVEPREKRAWFLERVPEVKGVTPFEVFRGRWAQDGWSLPRPPQPTESREDIYIVSLKALHLTDEEVMSGLSGAARKAAIARYYPSEQMLDDALLEHLGPAKAETQLQAGGQKWSAVGFEILKWSEPGPREACLVLSRYSS